MNSSDPENEAARLIRSYLTGSEPTAPVDPVRIARSLGINVWSSVLDDAISGELVKLVAEPRADVDIYLNNQHSLNGQRFGCAHELGHYIHVLADYPALDRAFVFRQDRDSASNGDEVFADQFAGALLMPAPLVRSVYRTLPDPIELATRFSVCPQMMNLRLRALGLVGS